jgi:hypothetical protein
MLQISIMKVPLLLSVGISHKTKNKVIYNCGSQEPGAQELLPFPSTSRDRNKVYVIEMIWEVAVGVRIGINALTAQTTKRACRDCRFLYNSRIDYKAVDIAVGSYCRPLHNSLFSSSSFSSFFLDRWYRRSAPPFYVFLSFFLSFLLSSFLPSFRSNGYEKQKTLFNSRHRYRNIIDISLQWRFWWKVNFYEIIFLLLISNNTLMWTGPSTAQTIWFHLQKITTQNNEFHGADSSFTRWQLLKNSPPLMKPVG